MIEKLNSIPDSKFSRYLYQSINFPLRTLVDKDGRLRAVILPRRPHATSKERLRWDKQSNSWTATGNIREYRAENLISDHGIFGENKSDVRFGVIYGLTLTLALSHEIGLAHGDLSLSNVLVRRDRNAKGRVSVYLLDMDDALPTVGTNEYRRSAYRYDPYCKNVGSWTDVYVTALWIMDILTHKINDPKNLDRKNLDMGERELLKITGAQFYDTAFNTLYKALGPVKQRPTMKDIYRSLFSPLI
ncbi:hypothetical protein OS123_03260 [Corynebacterium sp. P5875]|uniref:Protein kinase domain-containing protein n=1 Tax=Corynebacterium antarcticum TaxID=2800405 RepID=A0A9Q4CDB9_9CORY|nr:hypothetical protein [Corynebacterium antarcticum]MCX7537567.1 hypothetical protein [Corynebacterium antarcticum]